MKKALALIIAVVMVFSTAVMASAGTNNGFAIKFTCSDSGVLKAIAGATGRYTIYDSGTGAPVVDSGVITVGGEGTIAPGEGNYTILVSSVTDSGSAIAAIKTGQKITASLSGYTIAPYTANSTTTEVLMSITKNSSGNVTPPSGNTGSSGGGGSGGGGGGGGSKLTGSSSNKEVNFSNIPIGQKLGGGSLTVGGSTTGTGTTSSVSPKQATQATTSAVAAAVSQAAATGSKSAAAAVNMTNAGTLTSDVMSAIVKAAAAASKGMDVSVTVKADTVNASGAVVARMEIDVAAAQANGIEINTAVDVNAKSPLNTAVANHFEKFFSNKVATVAFGQKGQFGMDVPVALKADVSGLNTENLAFYSYDAASNSYAQIATEYSFDKNGYLHMSTPVGGSLVIADKPLSSSK